MSLIAGKLKVIVIKLEYRSYGSFDPDLRKAERLAGELKPSLLDVIGVQVRVSEREDELAGFKIAHLSYHHREQRIRRDVEREAQKNISRSLIELTRQFSIGDIKLKQQVARRQRHLRNLTHVPRVDDQSPGVRIGFDLIDHLTDLIDRAPVRRPPRSPLRAIDGSQFSVFAGPLVPDVDAVLPQVVDAGVASQKPQQLVDD